MSEKVGQFVAIMGNPYSGARDNRLQVQQLVTALNVLQIQTQIVWDLKERAICLADRQWKQRCRCLVIAGGDGTVAGVVSLCRDLPVAILPLGNENLLAKELGFTCDASAMAGAIAHGQTRRIDLGQVNGRPFTIMVSCGLDADVVKRVAQWRQTSDGQRRVKHCSYLKPAFKSIWNYDFPKFHLMTDDQQVEGYQLLVFNMNRYARGLNFVPDAKVDDGLLHWLVWKKPGRLNLLRLLWLVKQGRHVNHKYVVMGKPKA
ncbi:MAG: NAD(+)/NADH kinase [Phycisphaeraceae bacterium]|nr:NAD(+)/NADH kinase [Phycisphaeraceae bacterium]